MVDTAPDIDRVSSLFPPEDIVPVKLAVDATINPLKTAAKLHDQYFPEDADITTNAKKLRVSSKVKYIKSKYPEIFKPFRDADIVDMSAMVKDLVNMALDKTNKTGDRIKAHKVILDTAVQAEKFSKDKEISEKTLETVAFEEKTFEEVINETRNKHVITV